MGKKTELMRNVNKVRDAENRLSYALSELSAIATEIYGEDLQADLCSGAEIEFRRRDKDGYFDALDCVRLEDILKKL